MASNTTNSIANNNKIPGGGVLRALSRLTTHNQKHMRPRCISRTMCGNDSANHDPIIHIAP